MTIKDFKAGQKAYVLRIYPGGNHGPEITETIVKNVGRKYVTVQYGGKYKESNNPYGLIEAVDWGVRTFLCPSRTDAEMYIEKHKLHAWLRRIGNYGGSKYTLEQLRQVKAILEPEEEGT